MRRYSPLFVFPVLLILAACSDEGDKKPAADAQPAATQTVAEPAKATIPASTVSDVDLAPLFGNWATEPAQCAKPIQISNTKFVGNGACDITGFADNGDGTFTATCGKQKLKMEPLFGPAGEGVRITADGGKPLLVFRCSPAKAP